MGRFCTDTKGQNCSFDFRENSPTLGECVYCGKKAPANNIFDPEVSR